MGKLILDGKIISDNQILSSTLCNEGTWSNCILQSIEIVPGVGVCWKVILQKWLFVCFNFALHIETETKCPTFLRRHFQMDFLDWKYIKFN